MRSPMSVSGVSTSPGATATVVNPCGASSIASCRVSALTAPLLASYSVWAGSDREPFSDVVKMNPSPATAAIPAAGELLRRGQSGPDVQPEDEVEVRPGQVEERRFAEGADVVHQHVEPAERRPTPRRPAVRVRPPSVRSA